MICADLLVASRAADSFLSTYLQAGIGGAWNWEPIVPPLTVWDQADALLIELCWLRLHFDDIDWDIRLKMWYQLLYNER